MVMRVCECMKRKRRKNTIVQQVAVFEMYIHLIRFSLCSSESVMDTASKNKITPATTTPTTTGVDKALEGLLTSGSFLRLVYVVPGGLKGSSSSCSEASSLLTYDGSIIVC